MHKDLLSERIGQRLRSLRKQRQLSLDAVADLTGVSKPMLGQIERGSSNPTVATLWKIATGLKVPFTTFVAESRSVQVRLAAEQDVLYEDGGRFEVYTGCAFEGVQYELFRVRLLPGCRRESEPHGGHVTESITVHQGILTLQIEDQILTLQVGDSVTFGADVFHLYENLADSTCEIAMVIYYA